MKAHRPLLLSFSTIFLVFIFSLFFPSRTYAENCTSDTGKAGVCMATMACPPADIDGKGSCSQTYDICCLNTISPTPTPPGSPTATPAPPGAGDCSSPCTTSANCMSIPNKLDCAGGVCTNSTICPSCTGTSGSAGSCLSPSICAGLGKNSTDGTGSCTGGSVCCTNAASSQSCTLVAPNISVKDAEFPVVLSSTDPNTTYTITTSPSDCIGSCIGNQTTDSLGDFHCHLACSTIADYTITAQHGVVTCTATVKNENIPGTPCNGDSGIAGWCHAGPFCISGTIGDGVGTCTGTDVHCCIPDPSLQPTINPFCNSGGKDGVDTAIGCVPYDPTPATTTISRWALGIAGGIALLMVIYSGLSMVLASGDPKKIQAGREILLSALGGVAFIILSLVILQFIGIDVLNLSSLGFQ
jgi:hypothetical protein